MCQTDLFYQNKQENLFSKVSVKLLRNSIKYMVSRAVSGALSGAVKLWLWLWLESYGYSKCIFR